MSPARDTIRAMQSQTIEDEELDSGLLEWYSDGRNVSFLARWSVDHASAGVERVLSIYETPWLHNDDWGQAVTWSLENIA